MVRVPNAANFKDIVDLLFLHLEQKQLFRRPRFHAVTFATLGRILFPPTDRCMSRHIVDLSVPLSELAEIGEEMRPLAAA